MSQSKKKEELDRLANAIIEEYLDKGLVIEGGWQLLKAMACPPDAPQIQIDEMRNAFFAGAQHLFGTIMCFLEPGAEPTKNDLRRMTLIHEELERFLKEYKFKHFLN